MSEAVQRSLSSPSRTTLTTVIFVAIPALVGLTFGFNVLNRSLAPYTIVDYEFAWTAERAATMFAQWGELGVSAARLSLWLDFVYIPAYALLSWALALLAARAAMGRWQPVGPWVALLPFLAGMCDAVENLALLSNLPPLSPSTTTLSGAGACAAVKFGLLFLVWAYTLIAPLAAWVHNARRVI